MVLIFPIKTEDSINQVVHESSIASYCRTLKCPNRSRLWKRKAYHGEHIENAKLFWKGNKGSSLDIDTIEGQKMKILFHMSLADTLLKNAHGLPEKHSMYFGRGPLLHQRHLVHMENTISCDQK